jgi:hypothetical protein
MARVLGGFLESRANHSDLGKGLKPARLGAV